MNPAKELQSALVLSLMGAILSLAGLVNSLERRMALAESVEYIRAIGPHERDIATELVAPAIVGNKNERSILEVVGARYEESHRLLNGWLSSVAARRKALIYEAFLWAAVMSIFVGVAVYQVRLRRAL